MTTWALVADAVPVYPLYALLFADSGLSTGQISALFALWSLVSALAEVPFGALADRFPRRRVLVAAGLVQAAGMACWTVAPDFAGFALGFVLWGLSGSLVSGAREALLFDGLDALGARAEFPGALGRLAAAELVAQLPAAVAASLLFPLGGYTLVGAASVASCTLAAGLAARIPEPRPPTVRSGGPAYVAGLLEAVAEVRTVAALRAAAVALALVSGLDAVEEYFGLLVHDWHVPVDRTPVVLLSVSLAGALGAWAGGLRTAGTRRPAALLALAGVLLALAALCADAAGVALLACFYGCYRAVSVVVLTRLQERIERARATVTSLAALLTEGVGLGVFAVWALCGVRGTAVLVVAVAAALALLLRPQRRPSGRSSAVRSSRSTSAG